MRYTLLLVAGVLTCTTPCWGVLGDVNQDGQVDFSDFFILAENFGKTGPPKIAKTDTVVIVQRDTLRIVKHVLIDDGQQVILDDNGTWEHIEVSHQPRPSLQHENDPGGQGERPSGASFS